MASVTWNAPVSLCKKPKGARKQAAEARLEQYKQWIVASLPKTLENAAAGNAPPASILVSARPTSKPSSAAAARRRRQQQEMIGAAASLLVNESPLLANAAAAFGSAEAPLPSLVAPTVAPAPAKHDPRPSTADQQVKIYVAGETKGDPADPSPLSMQLELQRMQVQQLEQLQRMQELQQKLDQQKQEQPKVEVVKEEPAPSVAAAGLHAQLQQLQPLMLGGLQAPRPVAPPPRPTSPPQDQVAQLHQLQLQQQQLQLQIQIQQQQQLLQRLQSQATPEAAAADTQQASQQAAAALLSMPSCA